MRRARPPRPQPARKTPARKTAGPADASAPAPAPQTPDRPTPAPRRRPQKEPDVGFVAVGRVLAPFGLKGELKVQILTDNERRFASGARLYAGAQPVTVAKARFAQGYAFVTLKGFAERSAADQFRHAILQVREEDLPALPEGEFYRFQLIGMAVVDADGAAIGVLEEVIETGANDVYRVRTADGSDVLLPALDDVVLRVDVAARTMTVAPMEWR